MKKIITVILVAAMAISMTACAKHTTPTVTSEVSSNAISSLASDDSTTSTVSSSYTSSMASSSQSSIASSSTATSNTSKAASTASTGKSTTGNSNHATQTVTTTPHGSGTTTTHNTSNNNSPAAKPSNGTSTNTNTAAPSSFTLVMPTSSQLADLSNQVLSLINAERSQCGAATLRSDPKLTQAAQIRAKETITNNGHTRPDGTLWATILTDVQYGTRRESQASNDGIHWHTEVDYDSGAGAENLTRAWYDPTSFPNGFRCTSAEFNQASHKIFNDWKSSSGHF